MSLKEKIEEIGDELESEIKAQVETCVEEALDSKDYVEKCDFDPNDAITTDNFDDHFDDCVRDNNLITESELEQAVQEAVAKANIAIDGKALQDNIEKLIEVKFEEMLTKMLKKIVGGLLEKSE